MARRLPPLTQVRAFEAAARRESFKAAADELHVTDAVVSQHVKQLEARLGVTLFLRTRRGVRLTAAGKAYLPDLSTALDLIAGATARLGPGESTSTLTVSVAPSLGTRWLVPRLERFHAAHPEIRVCPVMAPEFCDFDGDEVDVAIRHGGGAWPGVRVEHLKDEALVPVCAPGLLGARERLDVTALLDLPALVARPRAGEWPAWLRSAGAQWREPVATVIYATLALAIDAAVAGTGVALVDRALIAEDLRANRLRIPLDHACAGPNAYYVVTPKSASEAPKVTVFRDWLVAEAAAESL